MIKRLLLTAIIVFLSSAILFAQQKIKGKVVGEDKTPLNGATIKLKNAKTTVLTNESGDFTITAPQGEKVVLSVSSDV